MIGWMPTSARDQGNARDRRGTRGGARHPDRARPSASAAAFRGGTGELDEAERTCARHDSPFDQAVIGGARYRRDELAWLAGLRGDDPRRA